MRAKKIVIRVIIIFGAAVIALTAISAATYAFDCFMIKQGNEPMFARAVNAVNDGGTLIYCGLGYHIIKWHSLPENVGYDTSAGKYVCGWDIRRSYDVGGTLRKGPDPADTYELCIVSAELFDSLAE